MTAFGGTIDTTTCRFNIKESVSSATSRSQTL